MKIGEAARLANISKRTLYYYEEIGILVPERINTYRYYSEKDYIKLQQILLLKSIGYSIIQIVEFFKSTDSFNDDDLFRSLGDQLRLLEERKEKLDREIFYLKSTMQYVQIKSGIDTNKVLEVIDNLESRSMDNGVIKATFEEDNLTHRELEILNNLPIIGSNDARLDEIIDLIVEIRENMHVSPYSKTQQKYAQKIHDYSMLLFEGDEMLMNKYWEMITPADDTSSKVLGMDKTFMDYINKMMDYFENNKLNK
ncbi:MerR family transcriptional regulator [Paenibacillus eucommiae]|nr:MerR family transcriptional regulator [Paenibacillus eucommiae]